jgi:hypothetical protein
MSDIELGIEGTGEVTTIRRTTPRLFGVVVTPLSQCPFNFLSLQLLDQNSIYLFSVRRAIEKELRRICLEKFGDENSCKRAAGGSLILSIQRQDLLSRDS